MKICEYCGNKHDGSFATGRFCNRSCSNGFSTSKDDSRELKVATCHICGIEIEINKRASVNVSKCSNCYKLKMTKYKHICEYCNSVFFNSKPSAKFCNHSCQTSYNNKHRIVSLDTRKKLSNILKKAYKDGRPNLGGKTKWVDVKSSNGIIRVQGSYEVRAVKILDILKNKNVIYDWEYTNDRITYTGIDNKNHTYLIDFKVFNTKDDFYYLEIKGRQRDNDVLKWKAVKNKGYNLSIWYNEDLREYESKYT